MAINQPLKGHANKQYSVITNFDGGIDRNTADDVARDNTFKELINFTNANEGSLSKRPGVIDSRLTEFIGRLINGEFTIRRNKFDETAEEVLPKLEDFYQYGLLCNWKELPQEGDENIRFWVSEQMLEFQIIKMNNFFEVISNDELLKDTSSECNITFIAVILGKTEASYVDKDYRVSGAIPALYLARVTLEKAWGAWTIEVDTAQPLGERFNNPDNADETTKWLINPGLAESGKIDVVSYNGFTYIPTGKNYIIKINQMPEKYERDDIFQIIGGNDGENLYKPTPIEATKVGFNILANDPISYIANESSTGVSKIKGIFYTIPMMQNNGVWFEQPIAQAPYNREFHIYVLYTGSNTPSEEIQYRPNNGETDSEKNPYKKLPGSWATNNDTGAKYFNCTGLDREDSIEIKITLGDDVFLGYVTPGVVSDDINNVGLINEINDLVFSSTRMKVINNQLVLYGNHGYLFFSEFNMFNYFPNYYYVFASNEAHDEQVTSINYFRQYYAVFTDRRIKKMVGSFGASDFGIYPLNDYIGCVNGNTVKAVGSNLLFLGNDGIYKLKQGYLGEGTENVEKIDIALGNELSVSNVIQAFTIGNYYIVVKNDGKTWICYNHETDAFYEYNLESTRGIEYIKGEPSVYETPFRTVFETSLYDKNGNFIIVPMYTSNLSIGIKFMIFRYNDLDYILEENKHKDGYGFISTLETHNLNMGYPTNTKKFKEIYIKMNNKSRHPIPLYVTIYVDDKLVVSPEHYEIKYEKSTNTYYYVLVTDNNKVLGEFTLGQDVLGIKTIQQVRFRIGESGRSIKLVLSDGMVDKTTLNSDGNGYPNRKVNLYDFEITSIGIVYKVKKVKEG